MSSQSEQKNESSMELVTPSSSVLAAFIVSLYFTVQSISALTPPFQSPDEFGHIDRAYLLSTGGLLPQNDEYSTGGYIDTGLLKYMDCFQEIPYRYSEKVSRELMRECSAIGWSGETRFIAFPTYASYFPVLYAPQAAALLIGRLAKLSVQHSYYLARFFSLVATLAILYTALRVHPLPLPVLALFITPMTLFQMGSATLDSVAYSVTLMATSLFLRASDRTSPFTSAMHLSLFICCFSIATSRFYMLFATLLPAFIYLVRRSRYFLVSAICGFLFAVGWFCYVLRTVHQLSTMTGSTPTKIAWYYVQHMTALFNVFYSTMRDSHLTAFYARSFIGILGWLDTPLASATYFAYGILFVGLMVLCIKRTGASLLEVGNVALAAYSAVSLLTMYLIFLLTWTAHPAAIIVGVQGRYFTLILIPLVPAICRHRLRRMENVAGVFTLFLLLQLSAISTLPALLNHYWMTEKQLK